MQGSDSAIITIFIVSTLIVLVLVGVIVSFVLLYQRRVLQQKVSLQNMEVEFQKELLSSTLESQEAERSRIAKDLHDSVGVMLSTLRLAIKRYEAKGTTEEAKGEMVALSTEIIDGTIGTVRRISHDLLPPELEMMGLGPALEQAAWRVNETGALQVYLDMQENLERPPRKVEIVLFRIVQELLNNTLKHAEASECRIVLAERHDGLALSYSDNGKGISTESIDPVRKVRKGLGLKSVESRAESLGASLVWDTNVISGMRLEIVINSSHIHSAVTREDEKDQGRDRRRS